MIGMLAALRIDFLGTPAHFADFQPHRCLQPNHLFPQHCLTAGESAKVG
jgi:hypothetical protein